MNAFNGVKVFAATMVGHRRTLGEQVTEWLQNAAKTRSGFEVVDITVRQSSDDAYHCTSIVVFFNEDLAIDKGDKRRG